MGRRKIDAATSEEPEWWLRWFMGSRACCDPILYEYLPGTMTEGEISALKEAVKRDGECEYTVNKRGFGSVRDTRALNGESSD
jgi:hypothetical protein